MNRVLKYTDSMIHHADRYHHGFEVKLDRTERNVTYIFDNTGNWTTINCEKYTPPPRELMPLLLANRQIFQEAMPVFYNVNTFRVDNFLELMRLLRFCGATRRAHFTHIEVRYPDHVSRSTAKKAFDLLAEAKQLQSLKVWVDDSPLRGPPYIDPQKVYWVKWLCKLDVPSLHIEGDGGKIETYIREQRALKDSDVEQVKFKKRSLKKSGAAATTTNKVSKATKVAKTTKATKATKAK